ncbi:MAG: phage protease [Desulfovibrionaceae bacterium]
MENIYTKATHSLELSSATAAGGVPEWIHVMPAGIFHGRDGRGPYNLVDAQSVANASMAAAMPRGIPMDYEHQLENSPQNGQPAPASGWITSLQVRTDGIWARVEWTRKAAEHVEAREYRYVSPVFYHAADGTISSIESVALTNLPNLGQLKALSTKNALQEKSMKKTVATLLNLPEDCTELAAEEALRQLTHERDSLQSALAEIGKSAHCQDAAPAALLKAVASLAAQAQNPDPTKYVPLNVYNAAHQELAALKAVQSKNLAEALVAEVQSAGKITPAMAGWAKAYASKDPDGFKAWASLTPSVRPGGEKAPVATDTPPKSSGLTEDEKTVCRACGMDEEIYKKGKE